MAFADEDLRRLKEEIDEDDYHRFTISTDKLWYILVRLEAAESVLESMSCGERENLQAELNLWRKSCGK